MATTKTVAIMRDKNGRTCSVWDNPELASAKAAEYNANPYNDDGTLDEDRPYIVETWVVQ